MRRQFQPLLAEERALSEQREWVQAYRSALLSITLAADPMAAPSPLLDPAIQPIPVMDAVQLIQELSKERAITPARFEKAAAQAGFLLARSAILGKREELRSPLEQLLGTTQVTRLEAELKMTEKATEDALKDALPKYLPGWSDSNEALRGVQPLSTSSEVPASGRPPSGPTEQRPSSTQPPPAAKLPSTKATSTLDVHTLRTTVSITSGSNLPFQTLAESLDPRNWEKSPFWPEARQLELDKQTRRFLEPEEKIPLGKEWHGHFYERVEWNWNLATVSSFRNYLIIRYVVKDPNKVELKDPVIDLSFSLYSCAGSRLYALELDSGVDADWGCQRVYKVSNTSQNNWRIVTEKNLRFSDILKRSTPFEGIPGSGQLLAYLAPAIVGLWMNDLLENLDLRVRQSQTTGGN